MSDAAIEAGTSSRTHTTSRCITALADAPTNGTS